MKKSRSRLPGAGLPGSLKKSLVFRRANIGSASVRPPATASRPRTHPRASGAKPERFERFEGKRTRRSIARRGSPEKEQPLGARSLGAPCSFRGRERDDARAYVSRQGAAGARGALRRTRFRARCVLSRTPHSRASARAIAARSKCSPPFFSALRAPMPPAKRAADTSLPRAAGCDYHTNCASCVADTTCGWYDHARIRSRRRAPRDRPPRRARTRASSLRDAHSARHFQTRRDARLFLRTHAALPSDGDGVFFPGKKRKPVRDSPRAPRVVVHALER